MTEPTLAARGATTIHEVFLAFREEFNDITRRARVRFERRDWHADQADALERLECYSNTMKSLAQRMRDVLGPQARDEELWRELRDAYASVIRGSRNVELAETFFNSVTRKVLGIVGVKPEIEFLSLQAAVPAGEPEPEIYRSYLPTDSVATVIRQVLEDNRFGVDYRDLEGDAELAASLVNRNLRSFLGANRVDAVEILRPVFYRDKRAYIVGRIRSGDHRVPLVLPLAIDDGGIFIDAVLMNENEVSILFSFTRAYFQVEIEYPREIIRFLKTVMPLKPITELYMSLGFNKHGKTELYRDIMRHMNRTSDQFQHAEGDRGMVMLVFTLPMYGIVFKVIRDEFDYPKTHTRQDVISRYRLVFQHDRVGRLVEAQDFEYLKFGRDRFSPELLDELLSAAGQTVSLEGEQVVIRHLYTERKVMPLNLFIRQAPEDAARKAVLDYGAAIKELAAANIFPGDFLLKNFGVTRHGRVVFYDYDELCLLTDCKFRTMPAPRNPEEEMASEPFFSVGEEDVFPEEFRKFLGLPGWLRNALVKHHEDLFTAEFWRDLQSRHLAGEIMDFQPYPDSRRLRHRRSVGA